MHVRSSSGNRWLFRKYFCSRGRKIGRKEGRLGKSVEGEARPEEVSETSLMRF